MVDITDTMVIDILTHFHDELAVACAAGLSALSFSSTTNGGGTIEKVSINAPCDAAQTVADQLAQVRAGTLKVTQ